MRHCASHTDTFNRRLLLKSQDLESSRHLTASQISNFVCMSPLACQKLNNNKKKWCVEGLLHSWDVDWNLCRATHTHSERNAVWCLPLAQHQHVHSNTFTGHVRAWAAITGQGWCEVRNFSLGYWTPHVYTNIALIWSWRTAQFSS